MFQLKLRQIRAGQGLQKRLVTIRLLVLLSACLGTAKNGYRACKQPQWPYTSRPCQFPSTSYGVLLAKRGTYYTLKWYRDLEQPAERLLHIVKGPAES